MPAGGQLEKSAEQADSMAPGPAAPAPLSKRARTSGVWAANSARRWTTLPACATSSVDDIFLLSPPDSPAWSTTTPIAPSHGGSRPDPAARLASAAEPGTHRRRPLHGRDVARCPAGRHATFVAVAILGHGVGLPSVLTEEELSFSHDGNISEEAVVTLALHRSAAPAAPAASRPPPGSFLPPDLPEPVRTAFVAQQTGVPFSAASPETPPGSTDGEKAAITAPVFLGFGEDDLTQDFMGCAGALPSSQ